MGRGRRPKFSFPIPGRKTAVKKDIDDVSSIPSIPSVPEWSPHLNDSPSYSKAQRLLGTSGLPIRPSSRSQASVPQSPGFMTITVSEASFGSDYTDKASSVAMEDGEYYRAQRPGMSTRPSSNLLGAGYHGDGRRESNGSSLSRQLHPRTSNSTMRSYYDAQKSPPSISQQTSASAVRDMALRKGRPPVAASECSSHVNLDLSHLYPGSADIKRQNRKSKPPRLDLSRLFPKPRSNTGHERTGILLSPNKLVNSPTAMSTVSEYFPRPMTREPTPTPNTARPQAKLTKTAKQQQGTLVQPQPSTSPVRLHKRDVYDSAKINVRRPPRGIQHWFEGLSESSDEDVNEPEAPVRAPIPVVTRRPYLAPIRKSSLGRVIPDFETPPSQASFPPQRVKKEFLAHSNQSVGVAHHLNSPSQFSLHSHASTKTKESAFSKTNLQDSSVLSFSSSEDEGENVAPPRRKFEIRDSIDDHEGDIIIGKAQAFEMRPRHLGRAPSESKMSMLSTSTNAATIEVMYTPEPSSTHFTLPKGYSSRRSSHVRHPSVIHEDRDQLRPQTSGNAPMSPSSTSVRSSRTSRSEPRLRAEQHKLMAVTEEEEALLEMMRRKRAAMAQQSFTEGFRTAINQDTRQKTPPKTSAPRTSAFLSLDSPLAAPTQAKSSSPRISLAGSLSPLLLSPPSRGRQRKLAQDLDTSILRDSSSRESSTAESVHPASRFSTRHAYQVSPALELSPLSPLDPFPSPTPTIASPTTTDHASPLPSPVTPGLRHCDEDVDEVAITLDGVIEPPSGSIKTNTRRRTASSGADVSFTQHRQSPAPLKSTPSELYDLPPVSESSSAAPSIVEPKIPRKSSRRISNVAGSTRSQHSSIASRTSSPALGSQSRRRESVTTGPVSTRCSVSEDVLAAWGSLGGWRGYDTGRIGGL
ncbi:uncharacterized protein BDR25DRAFT_336869 [Lindgomyces ingoldianus]|uniref:Uncharacterized protein n=1 Tax=Lindgomyces ingoldianus TaxID=673940 RepID=A0ACB6QEQ0_9PLEO|nr:uncharacterized protein BDR25DRAFT_336869 [Lindgomyces ingoldianus]KAF2465399.1 hypothetical protein BDR25DRAFT_336869 [Lindgomyces ingoldianus]